VTLDEARETMSAANTRLGIATRAVWAAQAVVDQAVRDRDPYAVYTATSELKHADEEYDRSLREHAAAESALVSLKLQGEY
jgi:hypothetical protein